MNGPGIIGLRIRNTLLVAFAAALFVTLVPPADAHAQARDVLRQGVQVGAALPHDLSVPDQNDQVQNFQGLRRKKGLILIFSRSLSW